jgi:hypothetical protein
MTAPKKSGKTLADLRAAHDKKVIIPNRIRAGLAAMAAAGDDWMYEADFIAASKVSSIDISKFRDQFADFWAELPSTNGKSSLKRAWFSTKKLADKWKEDTNG